MNFANSTYLFALLGFLIPIAIHLWNKKEAKVIKVGSIQFVPTQDSNQSKSIQLNEVFLLLL
ncbi:MAG: BatA domain-containing protein, partial [Fulvivirga sp.]